MIKYQSMCEYNNTTKSNQLATPVPMQHKFVEYRDTGCSRYVVDCMHESSDGIVRQSEKDFRSVLDRAVEISTGYLRKASAMRQSDDF
jgi:hypothetical protein